MAEISTRSGRASRHIKRKPAANLYHAVRVAEVVGRPLNCFVTINFAHLNCSEDEVSPKFKKLRDSYFGPWIRRPSLKSRHEPSQSTFVWVIENSKDQPGAHWLIHIPAGRLEDFRERLVGWITAVAGDYADSAVEIKPINNVKGLGRYVLKGIDQACASLYGVRAIDQGIVHGKRSGFSRSLGPQARRACGYKPKKTYFVQNAFNAASSP